MDRVRFTSGEAVVVRVVAIANVVALLMGVVLISTLFLRAGDEYKAAQAAVAAKRLNASDAACSRPAPTTLAAYATAFDRLDRTRWATADAVGRVRMPDGRVVWLYGETTAQRGSTDVTSAYSTAITQRGGCLHLSGLGAEVLPSDQLNAYSITGGIPAGGNALIVTATRLGDVSCDSCTAPYRRAARLTLDDKGNLHFEKWIALPDGGAVWGAAIATDGKTVAVYATQRDMSIVGHRVLVATVPLAKIDNLKSWKFASAPVAENVQDTVTAWYDGGKWRVATVPASDIHQPSPLWTASAAAGPYTRSTVPVPDLALDSRFSIGPAQADVALGGSSGVGAGSASGSGAGSGAAAGSSPESARIDPPAPR